jgi:hypothetical protein
VPTKLPLPDKKLNKGLGIQGFLQYQKTTTTTKKQVKLWPEYRFQQACRVVWCAAGKRHFKYNLFNVAHQ